MTDRFQPARIGGMGWLFLAGLVVLPFDSLPYFRGVLREIGAVAPFYPFSAGMALLAWSFFREGRQRPELDPPRDASSILALLFLFWVFISLAVNWGNVSSAVFKGRTGEVKATMQAVLLIYCFAAAVYCAAAARSFGISWKHIEKAVLLSFVAPALVSVVEILYLYHVTTGSLLHLLRGFFSEDLRVFERARTVSGEPALFAVYCAFLTPWMLNWVLRAKGRAGFFAWSVAAYFIFIVVLTLSRTAYIMVAFGAVIFLALAWLRAGERHRVAAVCAGFAACFCVFNILAPKVIVYNSSVVENPVSTLIAGALDGADPVTGQSTRIRLGAQIATFGIALDNPVFGAGLAQAGFHMYKYIPDWVDPWYWEVKNWKDGTPGTPWAASHGLHARIAAEAGFPALLLWLCMWAALGIAVLKKVMSSGAETALTGAVLLSAVFGAVLAGFNGDSFRFFEYWITLGLSWAYLAEGENLNAPGDR